MADNFLQEQIFRRVVVFFFFGRAHLFNISEECKIEMLEICLNSVFTDLVIERLGALLSLQDMMQLLVCFFWKVTFFQA